MKAKGFSETSRSYRDTGQSKAGQILRKWREHRGWTLQQLAQKSGMEYSVLSRMETGNRRVRIDDLEKLARAYGVPVEALHAPPTGAGRPAENDKTMVSLVVSQALLKEAQEKGVDPAQTLERALAESLKQKERDGWLAENREAIESYNRHIEKHGVFGDRLRRF